MFPGLNPTQPFENRWLPPELDLQHAVAFALHDVLASLVKDLEETHALTSSFTISAEEAESFTPLEGESLWEWLKQNGHEDVIDDLTYRQLTAALTTDICHFVYESLVTCAKGKTTVAFSLLRKPFKEDLLILEWLCGDPEDFLRVFHGETTSALNLRCQKRQRRVIASALEAIGDAPVPVEDLHALRYSKTLPDGLEQLWQQATHIVTTFRHYATEPGNLNFVFSSASDRESQWSYYYQVVPILLFHTVAVVEAVASRFLEWDERARQVELMRRTLMTLRLHMEISESDDPKQELNRLIGELDQIMTIRCECGTRVWLVDSSIDRLWSSGQIRCPNCGDSSDLLGILAGGPAENTDGMVRDSTPP